METFGQLHNGKKFVFQSRIYTKVDEQTAVDFMGNKQHVKFFTKEDKVEVDIGV